MPTVTKHGVTFNISEELYALESGFHRKGHWENVTPTPEQKAAHRRAKQLIKDLKANPYIHFNGEDEIQVEQLETERWVADETTAEWLNRFRERNN